MIDLASTLDFVEQVTFPLTFLIVDYIFAFYVCT